MIPKLKRPFVVVVNVVPSNISISVQIPLFQQHPHLKQFVRPAIERAVQELVHPVVERSIKICLTTAEMIVKKVSDLIIVPYRPEFFQAFFLQLQKLRL